jgi:hypothetical protein
MGYGGQGYVGNLSADEFGALDVVKMKKVNPDASRGFMGSGNMRYGMMGGGMMGSGMVGGGGFCQ